MPATILQLVEMLHLVKLSYHASTLIFLLCIIVIVNKLPWKEGLATRKFVWYHSADFDLLMHASVRIFKVEEYTFIHV